jgi:capsule polysaccharide export protein KpsE/RkpR
MVVEKNNHIGKLQAHIELLERQLLQQDKAIERKDRQFEGLKACYKDDLINGRLG